MERQAGTKERDGIPGATGDPAPDARTGVARVGADRSRAARTSVDRLRDDRRGDDRRGDGRTRHGPGAGPSGAASARSRPDAARGVHRGRRNALRLGAGRTVGRRLRVRHPAMVRPAIAASDRPAPHSPGCRPADQTGAVRSRTSVIPSHRHCPAADRPAGPRADFRRRPAGRSRARLPGEGRAVTTGPRPTSPVATIPRPPGRRP